jgi:hypothetical protein
MHSTMTMTASFPLAPRLDVRPHWRGVASWRFKPQHGVLAIAGMTVVTILAVAPSVSTLVTTTHADSAPIVTLARPQLSGEHPVSAAHVGLPHLPSLTGQPRGVPAF